MRNYCFRLIAVVLTLFFVMAPLAPTRTNAQVRRVYDNGALGLVQVLRRLQTRGEAGRVVYLSPKRGESGQSFSELALELREPKK